ncbi:MAG: argininosuccinate lyase, partial [Endomicrobiia bacterium]
MTISLNNFIKSFDFDKKLAIYDIEGSIAYAENLSKCKVISKSDAKKIISGLKKIKNKIISGKEIQPAEDIHYAVENELIKTIGKEIAGKLHTGRSRNDQVVVDMKLFLKDEIKNIVNLLGKLQKVILKIADENINVIMPGYTHLQPAQPVLFSHWILSYCWMIQRDKERFKDCYKRIDELPLGASAFAGTSFPIDRKNLAKLLKFSKISENSVDTVSDRDFIIEFLSCCAITQMHLSRLSEEIIIWLNPQFDFIKISDKFTSGSSIMPQKRNPDAFELIRAKTGRIYGALVNILTVMKALPLSYNRDMQEDKPPMFDATETLKSSIDIMAEMLKTLKVNKEKMESALQKNYIYATELADYLARKKVPFRIAHSIVKKIVSDCIKKNQEIKELTIDKLKKYSSHFQKDIYKYLRPEKIINTKKSYGSTSLKSVKSQIKKLSSLISIFLFFLCCSGKVL